MGLSTLLNLFSKRGQKYADAEVGHSWLAYPQQNSRYLSDNDTLKVSACYACIRVLSEDLAKLPLIIYKRLEEGGKDRFPEHYLWNLFRFKPNALMDAMQFLEMGQAHLLIKGNFFAQKILNGRGQVVELYPLHPDCVRPVWVDEYDEESLRWEVTTPGGIKWILSPSEILHVRGLSLKGVLGLSPIDLARETLATAKAQEDHAGAFFGQGVRASGILQHPNKLTKEAATRLKESFEQQYGGSQNAFKTILLEEGLTWNQVSLSNEQSQFIESREFSIEDIARWFRVPPHKIGHLKRATYSNIEQQSQEYVTDSLGGWITRWEKAITTQLLSPTEWDEVIPEFLVAALLRGDTPSRYAAYGVGRSGGWLSVDEIREFENLNPLPDGKGKVYLEPLNMKEVGTDTTPAPQQEPPPPADKTAPNPSANSDIQKNAWRSVFRSRIARALRREVSIRQRKNGDVASLREYLQSDLESDIQSALISIGVTADDTLFSSGVLANLKSMTSSIARSFIDSWLTRSDEQIESFGEWEAVRTDSETDALMGLIGGQLESFRI